MPAPRSVLHDIHVHGLKHSLAHRRIASNGHLSQHSSAANEQEFITENTNVVSADVVTLPTDEVVAPVESSVTFNEQGVEDVIDVAIASLSTTSNAIKKIRNKK